METEPKRLEQCPACRGTGLNRSQTRLCSNCNGFGSMDPKVVEKIQGAMRRMPPLESVPPTYRMADYRPPAQRIKRCRTKGWRMPENAVYVGRPTKWGNPFTVSKHESARAAVLLFEKMVLDDDAFRKAIREELAGKDLACWCALGHPCHGDILLEIANSPG